AKVKGWERGPGGEGRFSALLRQLHPEPAAFPRAAFDVDLPAVRRHDAVADEQPQTQPTAASAVAAAPGVAGEQVGADVLGDTRPLVTDLQACPIAEISGRDGDLGAGWAVTDRVVQQVCQHFFQPRAVPPADHGPLRERK